MSDKRYIFHCYMAADVSRLGRLTDCETELKISLSSDETMSADDLNDLFKSVIYIYEKSEEGSEIHSLAGKLLSEFDKIYGGNRSRIIKLIPGIKASLEKCAKDLKDSTDEVAVETALDGLLGFEKAIISLKENNWKSDDQEYLILPDDITSDCALLYEKLGEVRNSSSLNIEDKDRLELFNNFVFCMLPARND